MKTKGQREAIAEVTEAYRQELWKALGYGHRPETMPSSPLAAALDEVRKQTQQLAEIRRITRS